MPLPFRFNRSRRNRESREQLRRRNPARVRDHLANERTFLAWMRTAISLMGFGVVIVRLRYLQPIVNNTASNGWQLGLVFALVGLVIVLLSTFHYFSVRYDIDADTYEPADRWVLVFSMTVLLLGAGIIYYVFTLPPSSLNLPPSE